VPDPRRDVTDGLSRSTLSTTTSRCCRIVDVVDRQKQGRPVVLEARCETLKRGLIEKKITPNPI
jgi:hypothetical protein